MLQRILPPVVGWRPIGARAEDDGATRSKSMSNGDGKRSSRNAWRRRSYSRAVRGKGDEALPTLGTATAAAATLVERPAVHAVPGTAEVTQDGGRDVDVADRVTARAGAEAA